MRVEGDGLVVLVLLGVSAITFVAVFASGDPVAMMLGGDAGPAQVEEFRRIMGLDRPLAAQYANFLARAVRGDFGRSLRHDTPAMALVLERLPATVQLALVALAVSTALAIPLGVLAATRRGSALDDAVITTSALGLAAPTFVIGTMLILLLAVTFPLLPPSGGGSWDRLIMPVALLAFGRIAVLSRFTRSGMIDVLAQPYVQTARAKGLPPTKVACICNRGGGSWRFRALRSWSRCWGSTSSARACGAPTIPRAVESRGPKAGTRGANDHEPSANSRAISIGRTGGRHVKGESAAIPCASRS